MTATRLALPAESRPGERRVALDPASALALVESQRVALVIQTGCGHGAGFDDADYAAESVRRDFADTVRDADIVLKVDAPTLEEVEALPRGSMLIALMRAFRHPEVVEALRAKHVTTLALDRLPRITRAQWMDVLSSQATIVGYKATLLAASLAPAVFPRLTTAAGTLSPLRVTVIGAGVAGLQAIATARRLGADVYAYDIRRAAKQQIESLGAHAIDTGVEAESVGGYARQLTREERRLQQEAVASHLAEAPVVICTAAIPGQFAPVVITEDMAGALRRGSVIVDAAADSGGNCALTRPGETIVVGGVTIAGPTDLASRGAHDASRMFGRNCRNLLEHLLQDGKPVFSQDDRLVQDCCLTHDGELRDRRTATDGTADAPRESRDPASGWLPSGAQATPDGEPDRRGDGTTVPEASGSNTSASNTTAARDEREASAGPADDLTRIHGIGPALQARLNAFGIFRYRDLAWLDDRGLARLEQQLEMEGRLFQDDWAGQARRLERSR